ncbi:MAG: YybS family protein [Schwartzia sp.]|nr:YybS family protein [Schwartzia sp. (in: firmicutes)]
MATRVASMTESGLLAAVTVVMALIGVYVPILGTVAILLWPLPILVLIVRHGLRWGVMAVAVAGVLTALLMEPAVSLRLALAFAPGGIALGLGFRREWSPVRTLVTGIACSMAAKLAALALLFALTGVEPFSVQFDMMEQSFDTTAKMYRSFGMSEAQIEESRTILAQNLALVRLLLPLIVVTMGLMDTTINYLVGATVLRRLGHDVRTLPPFAEWRLPSVFVYLFGFSLVGAYWGSTRNITLLYQASLNLSMLATIAGLVEGLSVYTYASRHFHWPKFLAMVFLGFMMLNGFLLRLLCLVGLFDMVLDYRTRYWREKQ